MGDSFRSRQGCDGPSAEPVGYTPDGTPFYECPGRIVTPATYRACSAYPSWEAGRAIGAAALIDESATLVAALRIIGAEMGARQQEEIQRGR